ncbi:MAG: tRNA (guanosine(37)-N1)-methyltransferase TrmD [Chloroflexota bacterium]|nr:tRNA (guanosine(37)-N1)-methyltransferase TrmD [Chloroflexota bacterium]
MHFDIFTLFPGMFDGPFDDSIIKRARESGIISIELHNIRDYAEGKHSVTDDYPYGGGGGMVMKPEPIFRAVESVPGLAEGRSEASSLPGNAASERPAIILLSPQGRPFDQSVALELADHSRLALVCGRYEGVDERVRRYLCTDEISIGDFVLSGGEIAAMVIVDAVTRLLPGALGSEHGADQDSHATGLLEHPHYTRPPDFRGWHVPDVLLSGHHGNVDRWRRQQSLLRTWQRRPDLLDTAWLTEDDLTFLEGLEREMPVG